MVVVITLKELLAAAKWAEQHAATVHSGAMPYADISIRCLPGSITGRTIVMCEQCDRVPGKAGASVNHHDVTDYDAA